MADGRCGHVEEKVPDAWLDDDERCCFDCFVAKNGNESVKVVMETSTCPYLFKKTIAHTKFLLPHLKAEMARILFEEHKYPPSVFPDAILEEMARELMNNYPRTTKMEEFLMATSVLYAAHGRLKK